MGTNTLRLLELLHVAIALIIQGATYWAFGSLGAAAVAGSLPFVFREITQAEYNYINNFTESKLRKDMPWYGPFSPKVWSLHSLLGWILPVVATAAVALVF